MQFPESQYVVDPRIPHVMFTVIVVDATKPGTEVLRRRVIPKAAYERVFAPLLSASSVNNGDYVATVLAILNQYNANYTYPADAAGISVCYERDAILHGNAVVVAKFNATPTSTGLLFSGHGPADNSMKPNVPPMPLGDALAIGLVTASVQAGRLDLAPAKCYHGCYPDDNCVKCIEEEPIAKCPNAGQPATTCVCPQCTDMSDDEAVASRRMLARCD